MKLKDYILLFLKGTAMGAADIVPGVSGGTIAFISGIYETLINSINSIDKTAITHLLKFRFREFWNYVNGNFLVVLLAGIGFSIITLMQVVLFMMANYPELLWAFFFGLIVASAVVVGKAITKWHVGVFIAGIIGAGVAYWITVASQAETPTALWFIFLSGALAICAMILPGISGSFILLLLGKYEYILGQVKAFNISVIVTFGLGCIAGLLSFSRLLKYLLTNFHNVFVALLTGFMIGSLNKVWPWKHTLEYYTDRHGEVKAILQESVSPFRYEELTGEQPYLLGCLLLAIFGFAIIMVLTSLSERKERA